MSDVHRFEMRPVWAGGKAGYRYDLFLDGALVIPRTSQPLCDAALWCRRHGKDGKVELARYGGSAPCLTGEISYYATRYLYEPDKGQMKYRKREPFDPAIRTVEEAQADE